MEEEHPDRKSNVVRFYSQKAESRGEHVPQPDDIMDWDAGDFAGYYEDIKNVLGQKMAAYLLYGMIRLRAGELRETDFSESSAAGLAGKLGISYDEIFADDPEDTREPDDMQVKLIFSPVGEGVQLRPEQEAEQQLVVTWRGAVRFRSLCFGEGVGHYLPGRKISLEIGREKAWEIINAVSDFVSSRTLKKEREEEGTAEDGCWQITEYFTEEVARAEGREFTIHGNGRQKELSRYIRERIPISHLFVLGQEEK